MDRTPETHPLPEQKWPQTIWIVRHGQSAGNVARDAAEAAGLPLIDIAERLGSLGYLARELASELPALMAALARP